MAEVKTATYRTHMRRERCVRSPQQRRSARDHVEHINAWCSARLSARTLACSAFERLRSTLASTLSMFRSCFGLISTSRSPGAASVRGSPHTPPSTVAHCESAPNSPPSDRPRDDQNTRILFALAPNSPCLNADAPPGPPVCGGTPGARATQPPGCARARGGSEQSGALLPDPERVPRGSWLVRVVACRRGLPLDCIIIDLVRQLWIHHCSPRGPAVHQVIPRRLVHSFPITLHL